jgi:hypothetical protein
MLFSSYPAQEIQFKKVPVLEIERGAFTSLIMHTQIIIVSPLQMM